MVYISRDERRMNSEIQQPVPTPEAPNYSVPWKFMDNWIGVVMLALIDTVLLVITLKGSKAELAQSAAIVLLELAYLLPVVLIFAWRRISWKYLGFGKFNLNTLGLGCGLLIIAYIIILFHNYILILLGINTQGEEILKMFQALKSPFWFFVVGVIFAPMVEEIFFRGFLFQGFRQRYGWINAALLSSAIFAAAHLDLASLIPTFVLGNVLAYVYHKSNSLWPGMILHFLVNAFGLIGAYFVTHFQNLLPM
jgi:membrane protease YdiL (CAAX protease family)